MWHCQRGKVSGPSPVKTIAAPVTLGWERQQPDATPYVSAVWNRIPKMTQSQSPACPEATSCRWQQREPANEPRASAEHLCGCGISRPTQAQETRAKSGPGRGNRAPQCGCIVAARQVELIPKDVAHFC